MESIFLIGFMGAGKTTLGKMLADSVGWKFIDSDQEIEKAQDMSVGQIFEQFGEAYFRQLEYDLIKGLDLSQPFVMSCGGGLPCFNGLMDRLNQIGVTIYLKLEPEILVRRLKGETGKRPLLSAMSEDELLESVSIRLGQRESEYEKAKLVVEEKDQQLEAILRLLHLPRKN